MKGIFVPLLTVFWFILSGNGMAEVFYCKPEVKYQCSREECDRSTEGFQHAEYFEFNDRTSKITACLWTNCYQGKVVIFRDKASGTLTATGKLAPAHPGNPPAVVTLTLDKIGNFTAAWGYGGEGLVIDIGKYGRVK